MPKLKYKHRIIALFNAGKLQIESANWYIKQGYALIIHDGRLADIVYEEQQ